LAGSGFHTIPAGTPSMGARAPFHVPYIDPHHAYARYPPAGYISDTQLQYQASCPPQVALPPPRVSQVGIAPPGASYAVEPPFPPQVPAPAGQHLHPRLQYSRPQAAQAARPQQPAALGGAHRCQPATMPTSPYFTIIIKNCGITRARIPVYASPVNQNIVTVGDVLAAVDSEMIGLEKIWEGNDPYGAAGPNNSGQQDEEPCLCLCTITPIDYIREVYGKAGFVSSDDEGPYVWEWRVKGQR